MTDLKIKDYHYELPFERIALFPIEKRDQSNLLVYQKGSIEHSKFNAIDTFLPPNSTLFFNNTRVIPARIIVKKESGAAIEIFLLQPIEPTSIVTLAMQAKGSVIWKCTIGNLKRWPDGLTLTHKYASGYLNAQLVSRVEGIVRFLWNDPDQTFAEVINECGSTPLPPYLKRKATLADKERYQTIYSHAEGAVAAPTAGLHFTEEVMHNLKKKNIAIGFLTLHVSAGTFLPVKAENAIEHCMHAEQVLVDKQTIQRLLLPNQFTIAVGTTSMRTLESIYWYGVKLIANKTAPFTIHKLDPYELNSTITMQESLTAILKKMDEDKVQFITGETSIYIIPSYQFKICKGLITNFHQPSSTLMLLVAAFVGEDWRKIYAQALENNYRFLSYGDSSLLLP